MDLYGFCEGPEERGRLRDSHALARAHRPWTVGRDDRGRRELASICIRLLAGGAHRSGLRVRRFPGWLWDRARRDNEDCRWWTALGTGQIARNLASRGNQQASKS